MAIEPKAETAESFAGITNTGEELLRIGRERGCRPCFQGGSRVADLLQQGRQCRGRTLTRLTVTRSVEFGSFATKFSKLDRELDQAIMPPEFRQLLAKGRHALQGVLDETGRSRDPHTSMRMSFNDALQQRRLERRIPGLGQYMPEIVFVVGAEAGAECSGHLVPRRGFVLREFAKPVI